MDPKNGLTVFCTALGLVYGVVPIIVYFLILPESTFLHLALLTLVAIVSLVLGSRVSIFDHRFRGTEPRIAIDSFAFHFVGWSIFLAFIAVTLATAPSIPLISAIRGASSEVLSQERGEFLKGRTGVWIALLYLSTFLTSTIIPYSIVLLYASGSRFRHVFAGLFFVFCVSFMQKALFLNLVLPLLAYLAITRKLPTRAAVSSVLTSVVILFLATYLSLGDDAPGDTRDGIGALDYFSAAYAPTNPIEYFGWRAFAVPIFTATDTLLVHAQEFGGRYLLGASSSLVSSLFGMERINIERYVFEHQFGWWNELANANAVFITDAYVNFGYLGVVVFAFVIGQVFRWFRLSKDVGFKSLWPLFAFTLFSAPLIGMLLSNGFLYMLFHASFLKISPNRIRHA